jgi:hypothetical protein
MIMCVLFVLQEQLLELNVPGCRDRSRIGTQDWRVAAPLRHPLSHAHGAAADGYGDLEPKGGSPPPPLAADPVQEEESLLHVSLQFLGYTVNKTS